MFYKLKLPFNLALHSFLLESKLTLSLGTSKTSFNLNLPPLQSITSITPLLIKNSFPPLTAIVVRLIVIGGLLNREGLLVICELAPESEIQLLAIIVLTFSLLRLAYLVSGSSRSLLDRLSKLELVNSNSF
jgi:hypothetical protein